MRSRLFVLFVCFCFLFWDKGEGLGYHFITITQVFVKKQHVIQDVFIVHRGVR